MGSLRSLICFVVLIAFTLQSFLVQTHIHNLPMFRPAPVAGASLTSSKDTPAPLDADKCLLCKEYLHGGVYLTPAAVSALPPIASVSLLPFVIALIQPARTASHNWMGRAPPRA